MIKENWKELLLSVVLVGAMFLIADILGDMLVPVQPELTISAELLLIGLAALVLPALLGTIPSGFLLGKKNKGIKTALFVPAAGAAIAAFLIMMFSAASLLLMSDVALQAQLDELESIGVEFFANMSVAEFRSITVASIAIGAVFMAVFNFAVGLAGGFLGRAIAQRKSKKKA